MAEKYTDAQKRASYKYLSKTVAIQIRVTKEQREKYRDYAEKSGMSLSEFIISTINEAIKN